MAEDTTDMYLPTLESCKNFGIARTNDDIKAKSRPNTYGFITGPQIKPLIGDYAYDFNSGAIFETINGPEDIQFNNQNTDGLRKNVLDEVILEFISNKPSKIEQGEVDGIITSNVNLENTEKSYFTMAIAPNVPEWLTFNNAQEWETGGGMLQGILASLGQLIEAGSEIMSIIKNVADGSSDYKQHSISKPEFTNTWKGSGPVQFDIPFVLFTAGGSLESFVRDIFRPIMTLNVLTSPKRKKTIIGKDGKDGSSSIDASKLTSKDSSSEDKIKVTADTINRVYPGMRFSILEPPSYIRITHSSGLFRFPRCAITSFSYNYKGPWIKTGNGDNKLDWQYSAFLNAFPNFLDRGFPCVADCKLSVTVVDPMYSDDWESMYRLSDLTNLSNTSSQGTGGQVFVDRVKKTNPPSST